MAWPGLHASSSIATRSPGGSEALAEAHDQGVIHRDVTPGNILLAGADPEELLAKPTRDPRVKLVDFGIAGLVEHAELSQKSRVLGTAAYVAPEALEPGGEVTPATDVYGAGAVAYELLTGKLPLGRFPQPSDTRADVLPELDRLVPELLDLEPAKRPPARQARQRAIARAIEPPAPPVVRREIFVCRFGPRRPMTCRLIGRYRRRSPPASSRLVAEALSVKKSLARAGSAGFQPARGGTKSPSRREASLRGPRPRAGWKPALPARARSLVRSTLDPRAGWKPALPARL